MNTVSNVISVGDVPAIKALQYAAIGFAVFPLHYKSKRPLIDEWQHRASKDPNVLREFWRKHPKAGIGVCCGLSDLAVIDVDPRHGGDETFARLQKERGYLWDEGCAIAQTGRGDGGRHYFFRSPEGVRLPGKLGPGVDLLSGPRYVVLEPSIHPDTGHPYRWEKGANPVHMPELSELPEAWWTPLDSPATLTSDRADALGNLPPQPLDDTPENRERVMGALATQDPDPRDGWRDIVFAVMSTGWADAVDIVREWSKQSEKYDETAFNELVRSCKPERRHGGELIGIATLLYRAKLTGWKDPRNDVARHDYHGDADNGQRFARKHRGEFLYVHSDSLWLRWDGLRWARCEHGEERTAAQRVAGDGLNDALAAMRADPTERAKDNYRQAMSVFRNVKRHDALLSVASTVAGMSIGNPGKLDADPLLLGVRNGVVNLRLGTLLAADPKMLISRQAGAAFDRAATCPQWLAFLNAVFEGDAKMIDFVQRAAGYALTGNVDEEKMFFLFGQGANGKSVFANVLHAVFGDYAVNVRAAMLTRDLRGQNSEGEREKIRLPGARLALINEVGSNDLFDDARLKELVARDPIGARALYGESYQFMPTHTIFLRGNHQPGAVDSGDAFWRRMVLIPFNRQFTEHERVPDLERRILDNERDGILTWIVDGFLAWQRSGLRIPTTVRAASDEYRRDTDLLGEWIDGHCKRGRNEGEMVGVLYESYCRFLRDAGVSTPSRAVFGRQIQSRGFRGRKSTGGRRLIEGLSLRNWVHDEVDEL